MKLVLRRIIGTTMVLGTAMLIGLPAIAATSDSDNDNKIESMPFNHNEHHPQGDGTEGHNMMGSGSGNMGMMASGSGHMGMMGSGFSAFAVEKDLSIDDVRNIFEGRLAWAGNKRLEVGDVKKAGEDTYVVDIVTVDNSLVEKIEINRKTGKSQRIE